LSTLITQFQLCHLPHKVGSIITPELNPEDGFVGRFDKVNKWKSCLESSPHHFFAVAWAFFCRTTLLACSSNW
jgi:hypothetical protein